MGDARQALANVDASLDPPDEGDLPPPPNASTDAGFALVTTSTPASHGRGTAGNLSRDMSTSPTAQVVEGIYIGCQ